jgi:hypothetical protein
MKSESLKELIELCQSAQCMVKLEACSTGLVVTVTANRNGVYKTTSGHLDKNDPEMAERLERLVQLVQ